uniref:Zf-3CxxC domain-containing protein n=1 Tax=Panagrellus redivivus TaxID=6233 RepID=A0A7E4UZV5_PANRE
MFEYDRLALDVAEQFGGKGNTLTSSSRMPCYDSFLRGSQVPEDSSRRLSGGSSSTDMFDCGASSGYGSPGLVGTPLASPAPNVQSIANQLHKMFIEQGFNDELQGSMPVPGTNLNSTINSHSPRSYERLALSNSMKEIKSNPFSSSFCHPPPSLHGSPLSLEFSPIDKYAEEEYGKPSSMPPIPTQPAVAPTVRNSNKAAPVAVEDGFTNDEIAQFADLLCSPKKAPPVRYQCHICYQTGHYISDCPMRFNSPYEELTPYQGRKKCYGEFQCQQCKRKWTSQNSVANEAQSCIKCHVPVFPHKQLPVDKAVQLGLVKAQKNVPSKIAPIGSGRPPFSAKNGESAKMYPIGTK